MQESLQGRLLVASPYLPDPNFYRSVVFMIEHQAEGSLGLILNRVSPQLIREVWETACDAPCDSDDHMRIGGPVAGPLMALHSHPELAGHEVVPRVWFASDRSVLESLVNQRQYPYRVYLGYAGWGAGQLDAELRIGGWLSAPTDWRQVFAQDEQTLWQTVVHQIGAEITLQSLKLRHVPQDPRSN